MKKYTRGELKENFNQAYGDLSEEEREVIRDKVKSRCRVIKENYGRIGQEVSISPEQIEAMICMEMITKLEK